MAQLNDGLRNAFLPDGVVCYLLAKGGQTERRKVVKQVTAGYLARWNEYRGQTQFRFVDLDGELEEAIAQSSEVAYGLPRGGEVDIYSISPEARDRVPPDASSPFWKLYGERVPEERFSIP